jgi:hypothetical protein
MRWSADDGPGMLSRRGQRPALGERLEKRLIVVREQREVLSAHVYF